MTLRLYRDTPLNEGTEVDPVDLFTGSSSETDYTVTQKAGTRIGATVQFDGTQYYQYNGGFTRSGETITLSSAPAPQSQGVVPGQSVILFEELYDQSDIPGVDDPFVKEKEFYIGDVEEIHLYKYEALTGSPGIELLFVDVVSSAGAETSWVQLASASEDEEGIALTYGATGEAFYTAPLSAFGTLFASSAAGATSIMVDTASSFIIGDYILINSGNSSQEVLKIHGRDGQQLNTSAMDFDHFIGETVYTCARKIWAKCTVPENAVNGVASNLIDVVLRHRCRRTSRL